MYYENLFSKLEEEHIKYLVVGGLAVNLHGVPRMTADVDIAIAFDESNVKALIALLENLGFKPKAPVDPARLADPQTRIAWQNEKHMLAFTFTNHTNPLEEVDVLLQTPFNFDKAYDRREIVRAGRIRVNVACVDDLIRTKEGTGRKQDEADIDSLRLVKEAETHDDR